MNSNLVNLPNEILQLIFCHLNLSELFKLKKINKSLKTNVYDYIECLSKLDLKEEQFFNQNFRYYQDILYLTEFLKPFDYHNQNSIDKYYLKYKHYLTYSINNRYCY